MLIPMGTGGAAAAFNAFVGFFPDNIALHLLEGLIRLADPATNFGVDPFAVEALETDHLLVVRGRQFGTVKEELDTYHFGHFLF